MNSDKSVEEKSVRITRGRAIIPPEQLTLLRFHRDRSGVGADRLMRGAHDRPRGLSGTLISTWLNEQSRTAKPEHLSYVLKRWAALPDGAREALTPEMKAAMTAEFTRTGKGPHTILKGAMDQPEGLNGPIIRRWMTHPAATTVNAVHWHYVMNCLKSLPDKSSAKPATLNGSRTRPLPERSSYPPARIWNRPDHQIISEEIFQELHRQRNRTGIGSGRLLKDAADKPDGLKSEMVTSWLAGATRTALPEHIAYVLSRYAAWPDK